jgi:hypothetical protein
MRGFAKAAVAAVAVLASLAAAGCAVGSGGASAPAGFAGYKWRVTTITDGGPPTSIPASDDVYLAFTPNGQFVANEPVNIHGGIYRQVAGGFTTSELGGSAVGWLGGSSTTTLAINAISAFNDGTHADAAVSGNRMTVTVGGYRLGCLREGRQPNFPAAPHT